MRGLGLTDAMDRMMRGFTGGAGAASQGIQGAVGMLAQQQQFQDKMKLDTEQAQAKMAADQAALKEKRAWDEQMERRKEDFQAADKGLRRRIVTEPNQQEFQRASQDVSARIKDNPVTNLFDSGLTGLVPAGVMTALEGGSVMNDPNNQSRLMQQREAGWERDPTWVDPKAKPPAAPPTALDPKRMQWFDTEARQKTLKPPALSQIERLLSLASDPNVPPDQQLAAQQRLAQVDQQHWENVSRQYEAAVMNAKMRLMGEQVAAGAPDAPFLEKAIAGLSSKYGPQPWSPGEGDVTEPESFAPPMAPGDEPGDVGDIDVDDESIPLETRIQALGGGQPASAAPTAPPMLESQWLPGGNAQLADGGEEWRPPSRVMGRPPLTPQESKLTAVREAEEGTTGAVEDAFARRMRGGSSVNPLQFPEPEAQERMFAEQGTRDLVDESIARRMRGGAGPGQIVDPWGMDAGVPDQPRQQADDEWQMSQVDSAPPEPQPAADQVGLGDLTKFLGQFAGQGDQALNLLTGGAQSQALASTPTGPPQPTVGLEGGGMSREVPLTNVASGINLAGPAAQSFQALMNDPNMTDEWRQILLYPGQRQDRAFRTMGRQQEMRDQYQAGDTGGMSFPPGRPTAQQGFHTSGTALDLGEVPPMLAELLKQYGWRQNVGGDYTHWGFMEGP